MKPTRARWLVFALGCGTSWFLYVHRYSFGLIKSDLVRNLGLTGDQLGDLDAAFFACYAFFQIPLGLVVDLLGVHLFLGVSIGLWSIALAMHAWAPGLGLLWLARALLGAGQSAVFAALSRVTRTWFPASIRTTVQGWIGVFFARIGGSSANILIATVLIGALALGWRTAIYILAAAGIVHAALFLLFFRDSPRKHPRCNAAEADLIEGSPGPDSKAAPKVPLRILARQMSGWSLVNVGFLCLEAALSSIADLVFSNWIPLYLENALGMSKAQVGIFAALPLAGGALGGVAGGILNDRLLRGRGTTRRVRTLVGLAGKGCAALLLGIALLFYANPSVFALMLIAVKFFADISLATRWGAVTDIGGRVTATVFAVVNAVGIVGPIVGSVVYGRVIPQKGAEMAVAAGWMPMFLIMVGAYVACALSWLFVNSARPVLPEAPAKS